ncbi:MAG: hypothetical protein KDB26_08890 [Microthrixaceae bacterium]|nr:hypothetical protein [Microthrixaceae bacterium]
MGYVYAGHSIASPYGYVWRYVREARRRLGADMSQLDPEALIRAVERDPDVRLYIVQVKGLGVGEGCVLEEMHADPREGWHYLVEHDDADRASLEEHWNWLRGECEHAMSYALATALMAKR